MKIFLNKILLIILFILNISCESESHIIDSPLTISSECNEGESLGCDDICSSSPSENDACGVCGGDGSSCPTESGKADVMYNSDSPIAGFQFNVEGVSVTGASGGATAAAGFSISTSTSTVLAFSFSGASIPSGTGILISLEIEGDSNLFCIKDLVLSNTDGRPISAIIENCSTIKYSE